MPAPSSYLRRLCSRDFLIGVILAAIGVWYAHWLDRESSAAHSRAALRDSTEHVLIMHAVASTPPGIEPSATAGNTTHDVEHGSANTSASPRDSVTVAPRNVHGASTPSIRAEAHETLLAALQDADARSLAASADESFPLGNFVSVANVSPRRARIAADVAARMLQESLADVAELQTMQAAAPREQLAIEGTLFGLRRHIALLRCALIQVDRLALYRTLAERAEVFLVAA